MDKQDIIAWAHEAGATRYTNRHYPDRPTHTFTVDQLERFAKLVIDDYSNKHENLWLDRCHKFMLDEREACAKVCERGVDTEHPIVKGLIMKNFGTSETFSPSH